MEICLTIWVIGWLFTFGAISSMDGISKTKKLTIALLGGLFVWPILVGGLWRVYSE